MDQTEAPIIQTQTIQLDGSTNLTVNYQVSLGELLIASLLMMLVVIQFVKWLHALIMGGKKNV